MIGRLIQIVVYLITLMEILIPTAFSQEFFVKINIATNLRAGIDKIKKTCSMPFFQPCKLCKYCN